MKGEFYKMEFRAWNIGTIDLTLEQEAAYLRLCHAMYDVGGSVPNSTRMLMGLFRCGNTKATALLNALVAAGKIAVTSDNRLINHRVTEELADRERVSSARRVAGERGGTAPRATSERVSSGPRANAERPASDPRPIARNTLKNIGSDEAIAPTLRSREEERRGDTGQEEPLVLPVFREDDFPPHAFDLWWEKQPNKVGKDAARPAFDRVRKSRRATFVQLWDGLDRYIATKPPSREWCNPSTWLNQGRWADQPAPSQQARASPQGKSAQERALDRARQAHIELTEGRHDEDPSDAVGIRHLGASRPANGHAGAGLHEPLGGRLGLAPPRPVFPPRAH